MQILNHSGTVQGHLFTNENQYLATFSTVEYAQLFINWAATVEEAIEVITTELPREDIICADSVEI